MADYSRQMVRHSIANFNRFELAADDWQRRWILKRRVMVLLAGSNSLCEFDSLEALLID